MKEIGKDVYDFFTQKKVINLLLLLVLIGFITFGTFVRLENLSLLHDQTTGKYIPMALDPFYWLRMANTTITQGTLPAIDSLRRPLGIGFSPELLPRFIVFFYYSMNHFGTYSLGFIDVITPVFFFVLSIIAFFFLIYFLTRSKGIAIISSAILTIIPSYLYRSMAGFSDHDIMGMFAFFVTLLFYTFSIKYLENKKNNKLKSIGLGIGLGFFSAFSVLSWGGLGKYFFMIFPLSFLIIWFLETKKEKENHKKKLINRILFYSSWIISSPILASIMGDSLGHFIKAYFLGTAELLAPFTFLFLIVDYLFITKGKKYLKGKVKRFRTVISGLIVFILGLLLYQLFIGTMGELLGRIISKALHPFGTGRIGLTVAENQQPYLTTWISQLGKIVFWTFYGGMVFLGIEISKGIKHMKHRLVSILVWVFFISALLFSRFSSTSIFNGSDFLSKLFYFGGTLLFLGYFTWLYYTKEMKIKSELVIISVWLIPTLISARGAIRLFFFIVPFTAFMVGYALVKLFGYAKRSKDELLKISLYILLGFLIISLFYTSLNFASSIKAQAKNMGLSANPQWQKAMAWVRTNTPVDSTFVHWWDYGYWVEYLGERPTVADGGHFEGPFMDHLIGREVLTTPNPASALSFAKTFNVSYLLIDPSDFGKYSAYSKIGSGPKGDDRFSSLPIFLNNPKQTQETRNSTIRIYQGRAYLDKDIVYNSKKGQTFLPEGKAAIVGIILTENGSRLEQPKGVYVYEGKQIEIPLRFLHYENRTFDFKKGINVTLDIIPELVSTTGGININPLGAIIYLSPKTRKSLFAQLYLMDNNKDLYKEFKLVEKSPNKIVSILSAQRGNIGDFVYYKGLRGPLKIWKISPDKNIIIFKGFLNKSDAFKTFNNVSFIK